MKINLKKITTILLLSVIMLSTFTFFSQVLAQETTAGYVPLSPLPDGSGGTMTSTNITSYLISMFKLLIGVAGALAVVMIVIGGIQYMSTDAIYGKSEGKERIRNALGGLLLALVSWLILNTINPKLVEIKAVLPQATQTTTTTP